MNSPIDRLTAAMSQRIGRESGNFIGICLAILSSLVLMAIGAIGKKLGQELHPFEITFIRAAVAVLVLTPIFARQGMSKIKPSKPGLMMLNGLLFAVALMGWFWALPRVPLDLVASIGFTTQLYGILGAILFLGETPHARRWIALGVGFTGAMIILRPGFAELSPGILVLSLGTILFASSRLISKVVATRDNPQTLIYWQTIWVSIFSLPAAIYVWQTPNFEQSLWLAALAVLMIANQTAMAWALRLGDLGAIEPIAFVRLIWAALLGFVIFGDIPNIFTITGGTIVLASVIYIARRERQAGKAKSLAVNETIG